jgi:hypothetical protein
MNTMNRLIMIALALMVLAGTAALLAGCPNNPDADKKITEAAKVPGLDEAVLAKDRALQAAIEMSWAADVELLQEQLAVEEVRAGKVRITGIVSRPELKDRAESIAKNQEGVIDVVSTIIVDEKLKEKRINMDEM